MKYIIYYQFQYIKKYTIHFLNTGFISKKNKTNKEQMTETNIFFDTTGYIFSIWFLPLVCSNYFVRSWIPTYGYAPFEFTDATLAVCISVVISMILNYIMNISVFSDTRYYFFEAVGYLLVVWLAPFYGAFYFVSAELPTYNMSIPTILDMIFSSVISVPVSLVLHFVSKK